MIDNQQMIVFKGSIKAIYTVLCVSFCIMVMMAQSSSHADDAPKKVLNIQEVTSKNGLIKAWLVEDHAVPVIMMDFFFKPEGQLYNKKTQGITYLLSTMLDEGAGDLTSQKFQRMLEDYNISLGFTGGRDSFGGSLYMLTKYQDKGWDALHLAITAPRFDAEPLERMRRSVITAMRRNIGSPEWAVARLSNHYTYPDHYYALNSGGTLGNLEAFTAEDLHGFVKNHFAQDTLRVAVAGDITAAELAVKLDKVFGELPVNSKGEAEFDVSAFPNDGAKVLMEKDLPQTYLKYIWPSIDPKSPDYAAFSVMNYIWGGGGFSSHLMSEIREKRGLTYGVYSSKSNFDKAHRLTVRTSTQHKNLNEMRRLILASTQKMMDEDVTDEELSRAKNYLTGSLVLAFTNTKAIGSGVSGLLYGERPIDYLDGYVERINAVTAEDIRRVARIVFENVSPQEIYVGQAPSELTDEEIIKVESLPNAE